MKKHFNLLMLLPLNKRLAACFLALAVVTSCGQKEADKHNKTLADTINTVAKTNREVEPKHGEVTHIPLSYFRFEQVPDLTIFFDSIAVKHAIPGSSNEEGNESYTEDFRTCIRYIDEYRQGKRKFYPDKYVTQRLNSMGHYAGYIASNARHVDLTYSEWFMMCAAYYAPDITCLIHSQSTDHRIGIRNFGQEYNYEPWWCYAFIARKKGFEVQRLKDYTKINSLFTLENKGRKYYLLSNDFDALQFTQYLYGENKGGRIVKLGEHFEAPQNCNQPFNTYYFDKERKEWYYCVWDNKLEQRERVTDKPAMRLALDGENSQFIVP